MSFQKFKEFYEDNNSITVFDIDNTLVTIKAVIKGVDNSTGNTLTFTEKEFNSIKNKDNYTFDFSEFRDLQILKNGKLITQNVSKLRELVKNGKAVAIITARDRNDLIYKYIRFLGVTIPNNLIFVVNDPVNGFSGNDSDRKKQAFERLIKMGYKKFTFYDDSKANIDKVNSLNSELGIEIKSILV